MPTNTPRLPALPYARAGVTEGLSANQIYSGYQAISRAEGLTGMRRQDFLRLVSEVRASRGNISGAMQAPKNVTPSAPDIANRTTVRARGYGTWVTAWQRSKGQSDFMEQRFLIKSDEPITPAEAERRTGTMLANNDDIYDRVTLGVTYTGTEFYTPQEGQYG